MSASGCSSRLWPLQEEGRDALASPVAIGGRLEGLTATDRRQRLQGRRGSLV